MIRVRYASRSRFLTSVRKDKVNAKVPAEGHPLADNQVDYTVNKGYALHTQIPRMGL